MVHIKKNILSFTSVLLTALISVSCGLQSNKGGSKPETVRDSGTSEKVDQSAIDALPPGILSEEYLAALKDRDFRRVTAEEIDTAFSELPKNSVPSESLTLHNGLEADIGESRSDAFNCPTVAPVIPPHLTFSQALGVAMTNADLELPMATDLNNFATIFQDTTAKFVCLSQFSPTVKYRDTANTRSQPFSFAMASVYYCSIEMWAPTLIKKLGVVGAQSDALDAITAWTYPNWGVPTPSVEGFATVYKNFASVVCPAALTAPIVPTVPGTSNVGWEPQLTTFNGKLYKIWSGLPKIRISVNDGLSGVNTWRSVDGGGLLKANSGTGVEPQLTVYNSKLYATWIESFGFSSESSTQLRVAVYNGNDSAPAWTFVDGNGTTGLNLDTSKSAGWPQLTVFNSKLYLTWHEGTPGLIVFNRVHVKVFNGNDSSPSWALVNSNLNGLNRPATSNENRPQLTVFNSKLYATWYQWTSTPIFHVRVAVYNGDDAAPVWSIVDGNTPSGLNRTASFNAIAPQLTVSNSKLYATWAEDPNNGQPGQIRVAVYNGNDASPVWTFVDGNSAQGLNKNSAENANDPQATVFNGKLYLSWSEQSGGSFGPHQVRLAMYNGNDASPQWTFVDGNGANGLTSDLKNTTGMPQLTVFGANLYGVWSEAFAGAVNVYTQIVQ